MRISNLIFLSFFFILVLFSITTYINLKQAEKVKENSEYVTRSSTIVQNSYRFQRNILNMVSGLRGFLITGEDYFLQAYDSAALENTAILNELYSLLPDTSEQYHLLREVDTLNNYWRSNYMDPLRNAKISAETSDRNISYFNKLYKEKISNNEETKMNAALQVKIRELIRVEYRNREERKNRLAALVHRTNSISLVLTIFSIAGGIAVTAFLASQISNRVMKMVHMADAIASGNLQVHTEESGKDEISRLAQSLNRMANILSHNISSLQRKNYELDQFAHIVSHDMKAPLRGIDNVVTWIEEDHKEELTPKVDEYLQIIKGRIRRGENLISGLLSYARIDKEAQPSEEIDVRELIDEVREGLVLKPGLRFETDPSLPVLYSERLPLFQVFWNLISNAVKYNDKPDPVVSVYHREYPDHYEFFVKDNGPGISKTYHEKIFRIFQTLKPTDSSDSSGVGLAIVKKILDTRNERIHVRSEPGEGSVFSFTWKK
ncbi:MAG TPA: ATP-binding protein [Flavisolibacter sp.]